MKTKTNFFSVLIVISALLICNCGDGGGSSSSSSGSTSVDYDLKGTWRPNDPSVYSGTVVFGNADIQITGYTESQTPVPGGNDNQRPFRDFPRDVKISAHTEGHTKSGDDTKVGTLVIEYAGDKKSIPYTYIEDYPAPDYKRVQYLRFSFGGRNELLQKDPG